MAKDKDRTNEPEISAPPKPGFIHHRKVVVLKTVEGDRTYQFNKDRIVIGSVISADVRLTADWISPIHGVLEVRREGANQDQYVSTIHDLASDTGIFVNGKKIISQVLANGDQVNIGRYQFRFSLEDLDTVTAQQKKHTRDVGARRLFLDPKEDISPLLLEEEADVEAIFDYRPAQKHAVEVVMSWRGTILDVSHFVTQKSVTIGGQRNCDFVIPPILGTKNFPLVSREGNDYFINLDGKMSGVLQTEGEVTPLKSVLARTNPGPRGYNRVPIQQHEFAKIGVGEVDFYVSFTAAPPRLKSRRILDRDPFFYRLLATSVVLTLAVVVSILNVQIPNDLEAERLPDRLATVLYQPEKFMYRPTPVEKAPPVQKKAEPKPHVEPKPKPTPKPEVKIKIEPQNKPIPKKIPKEMTVAPPKAQPKVAANKPPQPQKPKGASKPQHEAREGQGARAKGPEGTRGIKTAEEADINQKKAQRPSPRSGNTGARGNSQVPSTGNIDVLQGASAQIQNLLGNAASKLGKGGGQKLQGFGSFDTRGSGGLALSGSRGGGGGTAESLGGLSDRGHGGGRIGTGRGATGNANGIVGGKVRVGIRTGGPEEAVVMGAIDASAVEAALLAYRDNFRNCYEREINAEHPNIAGRVMTNFVIGSSGRVSRAGIDSSSLKNERVERCIVNVIKRIPFPIPRGGGVVQVTYPFKFNPMNK